MERTRAATREDDAQPQDHDRIPAQRFDGAVYAKPAVTEGDEEEIEPDITIGQKMLSAVSGSVLTSLLGMNKRLLHFSRSTHLILLFQSHHSMLFAYDYNHNNQHPRQHHLGQILPFHILDPSQISHQSSASHHAVKKSFG